MQDLEIAIERLKTKGLTLSIAKEQEIIFTSKTHGISGFLSAIEEAKEKLEGASVADRMVGKAVALLCVYVKIKAIYAVTLSRLGKEVLEQHRIYHQWNELVESILDNRMKSLCPFEELATEILDPTKAYEEFKILQHRLLFR